MNLSGWQFAVAQSAFFSPRAERVIAHQIKTFKPYLVE